MKRFVAGPRPELALISLGLVIVGGLTYGAYIIHGGFYWDDWSELAGFQFASPPRLWSSVAQIEHTIGGRPLLALEISVTDALFGNHPPAYLGLSLALAILASLAIYALLRTLGLGFVGAGIVAVLALLFPWSDSVRLWATASFNNAAVACLCLGLILALHGLRRRGRTSLALHAGADVLYLISILIYEATAAAALVGVLLYLRETTPARAVRRWLADVIVVVTPLIYSLLVTAPVRHVGSLGQRIADVPHFARQGALLFDSALLPVGSISAPVQAGVLFAVAVLAGVVAVRVRRGADEPLRASARWLVMATVTILAAYFMFLGSNLPPLAPGIDNRGNVLAGPGYCLLVYATLAAAIQLLIRSRRWASIATVSAAALIAVGYGVRLSRDENAWEHASSIQHRVLAALRGHLSTLPSDSTLVTFGAPAQTAPEVPVFAKDYDLRGAVDVEAGRPSLIALPAYPGVSTRCERTGVVVIGPGDYGTSRARYGRAFFFDVNTGAERRISSPADCAGALGAFQ